MTQYKPVLTKKDFTVRYAAGEFGNASPTWLTLEAYLASEWSQRRNQLFHVRNRVAAGRTMYNVPNDRVEHWWYELYDGPQSLYISAMAPTEQTVIQGEVMQSNDCAGLNLYYTIVKLPMRQALAEQSRTVQGAVATVMLQTLLDANSWEWLNVLLDRYPGHVVEFSAYAQQWGTLPGYNTVFWEVRNY